MVRIAALIVGGIILLVLIVAVVNELLIMPNRSVATVNGEPVTLSEWQERVEYERAQRIMTLEDQLENFNGDIGLIQQFSGQTIIELINENAEDLGEAVLDRVIEEEIMRQEIEQRGMLPSEADVDERIGGSFNYYGGDSPTPFPDPTETVAPTPSLTPIPEDGAEVVEAPPIEDAPTRELQPTPTPVSAESFQLEYDEVLADFKALGVGEDTYRSVVEGAIITERLVDALGEEQDLPKEDEHASLFFLAFSDEAEANEALSEIEQSDYLSVWNTVRSFPPDPEAENPSTASASEVLWRTRDSYAASFGDEVTSEVFDLPLDTTSDVLVIAGSDGAPVYLIIQVSGREMRELADGEYEGRKQQLLLDLLDDERTEGVEISALWRSRVPTAPVLDPKFRQPPTPVPGSDEAGTDAGGADQESTTP